MMKYDESSKGIRESYAVFFAIQSLQVNTENRMTQLKYTEICDSICRYCHAVQTHRR